MPCCMYPFDYVSSECLLPSLSWNCSYSTIICETTRVFMQNGTSGIICAERDFMPLSLFWSVIQYLPADVCCVRIWLYGSTVANVMNFT